MHVQYRAECAPQLCDDAERGADARFALDAHARSLDVLRAWAERIPGFTQLCSEDQSALFNAAALELIALRIAYRYCMGRKNKKGTKIKGRRLTTRMDYIAKWTGLTLDNIVNLHNYDTNFNC